MAEGLGRAGEIEVPQVDLVDIVFKVVDNIVDTKRPDSGCESGRLNSKITD